MQSLIDKFQPITLEEMNGIKLMNRIDTKFVTTIPQLCRLLEMALGEYRLQEIKGKRNMLYHTVYFDTPDFDMYKVHQTGRANRQKIRVRDYVESDLQFLEVKTKNNRGRTKKKRIRIETDNLIGVQLTEGENREFLEHHLRYDTEILKPSMDNLFNRLTLVNNNKTERLTVDTNLRFHNVKTGNDWHADQLVIVELKRDGLCYSPILNMLRELRIFPHGFSKYCMGAAFTNEELPIHRFKPKMIDVRKIINHIV